MGGKGVGEEVGCRNNKGGRKRGGQNRGRVSKRQKEGER